jgi:hypothetical protein
MPMDPRRLAALLELATIPDETFALLCWTIVVTARLDRLPSSQTRDALLTLEPIALRFLQLAAREAAPRPT